MGQQFSKDTRSRLEHCTLEQLLDDEKYVEELEQHLPMLPNRPHSNLVKVLTSTRSLSNPPPEKRNSRAYKLRSLWTIQNSDLEVSESVAEALKQNRCNLWHRPTDDALDFQSPMEYYEYTCNVETRRALDRILWRFLVTSYYDLISELDSTKQRLSTTESGGLAFAVSVICQSGKHDPAVVRRKLMGWVKSGRRYRGYMNTLGNGCLIVFPEKISELVWEQYVPIKGSEFDKVIRFLRSLDIDCICNERGWNMLSDKILQELREPFRKFIAFQFQPHPETRSRNAARLSPGPVGSLTDMHGSKQSTLEKLPGCRPRNATNRVTKSKRGVSKAARQELRGAIGILSTQQNPDSDRLDNGATLISRQNICSSRILGSDTYGTRHEMACYGEPGAQPLHPATNQQCCDLQLFKGYSHTQSQETSGAILAASAVSKQGMATRFIPDRESQSRQTSPHTMTPPGDALQGHRHTEEELTLEEPGASNSQERTATTFQSTDPREHVTEIMDDDHTRFQITHDSSMVPIGAFSASLVVIQFEKNLLQQIVLDSPAAILGDIWFGSLSGSIPFVSLRLSEALGNVIKPSGREVFIRSPGPDADKTNNYAYSLNSQSFLELIQRDGFGGTFWNETNGEAFVSIEVMDRKLAADFFDACREANEGLPLTPCI